MNYSDQGISISPITKTDLALFTAIYTCPKMMRHLGGPLKADDIPEFFSCVLTDRHTFQPKQVIWTISNQLTKTAIGFVGLVYSQSGSGDGNLGIMIQPKTATKGAAKTAMDLFMTYLFSETDTLIIRSQTAVANKAAYLAAKSVGFKFTPLAENHKKTDNIHGIILKETWKRI